MKETKKLTISAMTVALGVVFMVLGAVFEVLDLSAAVLASLLVVFIYIEIGSPYTWLVWLATSLGAFLLYPGSLMWLVYLTVFGIYPILKGYFERLPRVLWIILKLAFVNISMALLTLFAEWLTGVSFLGEAPDTGFNPIVFYAILWLLMNVAFFLYDKMIGIMLAFYYARIRPKIERILK